VSASTSHLPHLFQLLTEIFIAHSIRHEATKQFRAVSILSAKFRWCLTGTPIQNSLTDLGALVKFLRVPLLETTAAFRYYIAHPIESEDRGDFSNLRSLLNSICLRRTNDILELPKPVTLLHQLELSRVEDEEYANIGETYRQEIGKAFSGHKTSEAYCGILRAILHLRLLCNHGTYNASSQDYNGELPPDPDEAITLLQQSDSAICAYCSCDITSIGKHDDPESGTLTVCSHILCGDCVPQYKVDLDKLKQGNKAQCPLCYALISQNFLALEGKGRIKGCSSPGSLDSFDFSEGYSSKLSTLLEDVENHLHKDKR
jgi:SWI/SNF-related matrix-associated actin-dependent regulator of chromatin subfamily A3